MRNFSERREQLRRWYRGHKRLTLIVAASLVLVPITVIGYWPDGHSARPAIQVTQDSDGTTMTFTPCFDSDKLTGQDEIIDRVTNEGYDFVFLGGDPVGDNFRVTLVVDPISTEEAHSLAVDTGLFIVDSGFCGNTPQEAGSCESSQYIDVGHDVLRYHDYILVGMIWQNDACDDRYAIITVTQSGPGPHDPAWSEFSDYVDDVAGSYRGITGPLGTCTEVQLNSPEGQTVDDIMTIGQQLVNYIDDQGLCPGYPPIGGA